MYKLLIPLFICLLGTTTILHAQVPKNISVPTRVTPAYQPSGNNAEMMCNNAGTFQLGAFTGQSNDTNLAGPQDTIFLCRNDQIEIDHNGDSDLSGDPQPSTPPGIGWAFYTCAPTIMGDNLATVLTDPCLLPGASNGIWVATDAGQPSGDITFINNGGLQTAFNGGQPLLLHFAPITLDEFAAQGFEGTPAGSCVNVNTAVEFKVVYLNAIVQSGVSTNFGNDCLGKFRIEGGYPQWNNQAVYTITITRTGNPAVKAVIQTAASQLFHGADVIFSVPEPGSYDVVVEDGKSCGLTFAINMNVCDALDNVVFSLPDTVSPPASQICVPITVQNFDLVGASFSLNWDPTVLQYASVQNAHPAIGLFNASNLNTQVTNNGLLGTIIYDQENLGNVISIPDSATLLEVCFTVIGALGECSPLQITNTPSAINIEDEVGAALALTAIDGQVCVDFLPLAITANIIDPTCNGTASIEVSATGGTAPYEVIRQRINPNGAVNLSSIATPGGTTVFTGLMNGDYLIRVTDNNGFGTAIEDTITIDIPTLGVALDVTSQLPSCNGSTDGVVTASVLIGNTPVNNPGPPQFTFAWLPATVPAPNGPVQNGVSAGNYSVTVTEASTGCTAVASGALGQPSLINDQNVTIVPASCTGICNGSISYTSTGGTPFTTSGTTYDYNWEYTPNITTPPTPVAGGTGNANPFVLNNLCAGTYYVTITDANGCTVTDELTVTNQRVVDLVLTGQTNTTCAKSDDGSACVEVQETPSSGNAFQFFWAPAGFTQTSPSNTSSCYNTIPAGFYNVLATDANGCADTLTVEIMSPPELVISTISLVQPSCGAQNDGAISIFTSGGTGGPNYTYLWSNGSTASFLNGLSPDTISVTVTDVNGCQDSMSYVLALPLPPVIDGVDSLSVTCGNDGCLTVNTQTGTMFVWQSIDGTLLPSNTSQICGIPGGEYIVTIFDDQGCGIQDTLTLGGVEQLAFSDTTYLPPSCFGYDDGRISVGVSGGTPNYTFVWTPTGQQTSTMIDVTAGAYTVVVTDAQGCTLQGDFTLTEPAAIVSTFPAADIQAVSCFGICDGQAIPVVGYDTNPATFGNFSFAWGDGSTDSLRTDLCGGVNTVTITDGNNCFLETEVFIDGPTAVSSTLTSDSTSCNGIDDGTATAAGTGGNGGPYTYVWSNNMEVTATINNLAAGTYTVTITDKDGCTGTSTAVVEEPEPITLQEGPSRDVQCFGNEDGELSVVVTGGNMGVFSYQWSDGTNVVSTTATASNLSAGTYAVTATDAEGCTGELANLVLIDPPPVQGSYLPWEPLQCNGDETTLVIDTILGGAGAPYQFSVDFGVQLSQDFPITLGGGEHYITYFDVRNCEYTDTITIDEPDPIVVSFDPSEIEIQLGDSITLQPIITGAVVDSFIWSPASLLFNPTVLNPTAYTFETETFNLVVFDENGCAGTGSILVNVDPNRNVFIPNIFTPASPSGRNDHFNVYVGPGVQEVNFMRVFNRWGELLYERNSFYPDNDNLAEGWDGRYKGDYASPGVYVYIVEVKFLDDRVLLYRGDVTIMR